MRSRIERADLLTLEAYSKVRRQMREEVIAHKKQRTLYFNPYIMLVFEDEKTIRYQIQEILRAEKIFEEEEIEAELEAYNPLLPDGNNFKATMLIQYADMDERRRMLALLRGVEDTLWCQVDNLDKSYVIADEDLERSNDEKTSAVHFLRFELSPEMKTGLRKGAALFFGCDHEMVKIGPLPAPDYLRESLVGDLG
ncbi:MAG TPA: DUF3501 family protein [Burkholderiales bacterium]|nr:DUF3501 family protein [Burkholderiales bacterium]